MRLTFRNPLRRRSVGLMPGVSLSLGGGRRAKGVAHTRTAGQSFRAGVVVLAVIGGGVWLLVKFYQFGHS